MEYEDSIGHGSFMRFCKSDPDRCLNQTNYFRRPEKAASILTNDEVTITIQIFVAIYASDWGRNYNILPSINLNEHKTNHTHSKAL